MWGLEDLGCGDWRIWGVGTGGSVWDSGVRSRGDWSCRLAAGGCGPCVLQSPGARRRPCVLGRSGGLGERAFEKKMGSDVAPDSVAVVCIPSMQKRGVLQRCTRARSCGMVFACSGRYGEIWGDVGRSSLPAACARRP